MLNFVFKFEIFLNELIKLTLKIAVIVFDFKKNSSNSLNIKSNINEFDLIFLLMFNEILKTNIINLINVIVMSFFLIDVFVFLNFVIFLFFVTFLNLN